MASAQRYASLANLSCATSSLCLSVSAAKALLVERLLINAARAAVANLSRKSWCSFVKISTCDSLTSGVQESLKTALRAEVSREQHPAKFIARGYRDLPCYEAEQGTSVIHL